MIATALATLCTGLLAGAAIYITLVEHPARCCSADGASSISFGAWQAVRPSSSSSENGGRSRMGGTCSAALSVREFRFHNV